MYSGLLVARLGLRGWQSMGGSHQWNRSLPKAPRTSGGAPGKGGGLPIDRSLDSEVAMQQDRGCLWPRGQTRCSPQALLSETTRFPSNLSDLSF